MKRDFTEDEIDPTVHCPYPKHRGVRWDMVVERDRAYAEFLVGPDGPSRMDTDVAAAIESALEEET